MDRHGLRPRDDEDAPKSGDIGVGDMNFEKINSDERSAVTQVVTNGGTGGLPADRVSTS